MQTTPADDTAEILRAKVALETAQIAWRELQRFFAAGTAISVAKDIDLVEAAMQISQDNKAQVELWMREGRVGRVSDEQAKAWFDADAVLWAVVVRPWVLVQPV